MKYTFALPPSSIFSEPPILITNNSIPQPTPGDPWDVREEDTLDLSHTSPLRSNKGNTLMITHIDRGYDNNLQSARGIKQILGMYYLCCDY